MMKRNRLLAVAVVCCMLFGMTVPAYALEEEQPVVVVSPAPTVEVTPEPTVEVTPEPTVEVTPEPTVEVTPEPTVEVTPEPTVEVTPEPTVEVTPEPTVEVTPEPTVEVTPEPTVEVISAPQPDLGSVNLVALEAQPDPSYTVEQDATLFAEGAATTKTVVIAGQVTVTLDSVNITAGSGPAIALASGADVTLVLSGDNTLVGAGNFAAISVPVDASLTIQDGETGGTLTALGGSGSAGIGGSKSEPLYGNITILSGVVTAVGGGDGAGIGSGKSNAGSYRMKEAAEGWGTITISGGYVDATGGSNGAGIGGGNHVDGGNIMITGDPTVIASGASGIGSGLGSSKNKGADGEKGPGYFTGGHIVIEGGTIEATSAMHGAGIGGGMYADSGLIEISGGVITATGGGGSADALWHHGGAGIGGGYLGHGDVHISGGDITATAGFAAAGIGSGGSPNSNALRDVTGRGAAASLSGTTVEIVNAYVTAYGGAYGGAGIGGGTSADVCSVVISGADVTAYGSMSSRDEKKGGAGIGGGCMDASEGKGKYASETSVTVSISNSAVTAIGGWGASGIGSGANNITAADITIDGGDITAYSDGTKFAIDTEKGEMKRAGITETVLQGTFVDNGQYEGRTAEIRENLLGGQTVEKLSLPGGYRSFARTVQSANYLAFASDGGKDGWIVFNTEQKHEDRERDENDAYSFELGAQPQTLSDNFYLYVSEEAPTFPPVDPTPVDPTPVDPTPVDPAPVDPAPVDPNPVEPDGNPGYDADDRPSDPEPAPVPETPAPEPSADVEIGEEEVPLEDAPEIDISEQEIPMAPGPGQEEELILVDEDVPLGDLPQTGTNLQRAGQRAALGVLALSAALTAAGATLMTSARKKS